MTTPADASITLRPDPTSWADLAQTHRARRSDADTRTALGLPANGVIVMSGHQTEFWHAGILAKWLTMHRACDALRVRGIEAHAVWLWIDQDTPEPWRVVFPVLDPATGRLGRDVWTLSTGGVRTEPDTPTACIPPLTGVPPPERARAPVGAALDRLGSLLELHRSEPSAARQIARVMETLLAEWFGMRPTTALFATDLARAPAFTALVGGMATDARACIGAYNAAATAHPEADLRPLALPADTSRVELPLWALAPSGPRRRVLAGETAAGALAPRALTTTAFVRAHVCDLFIHGLGGEKYERATEAWIGSWKPGLALAPVAVATATLRLPNLTAAPPPTPEQIARARWLAHHARHDPAGAGLPDAAAAKTALLAQMARAGTRGERARVYAALQDVLAGVRERAGARLEALAGEASALSARTGEAEIAADRTWPFFYHGAEALAGLDRAIARAFGTRA